MVAREILKFPHPVLRQRARKVRALDGDVLRLAHNMIDTMRHAGGVGLAANQVGELRRVIVIQLPEEDEARIYVNPEILSRRGERQVEERCLSIPGYKGIVTRSLRIKFRAMDQSAKTVKLKADEMLAQALEHEVDHLNGILYVDHMAAHEKLVKDDSAFHDPDVLGESVAAPDDDATLVRSEGGIWLPEGDARNTPSTMTVR